MRCHHELNDKTLTVAGIDPKPNPMKDLIVNPMTNSIYVLNQLGKRFEKLSSLSRRTVSGMWVADRMVGDKRHFKAINLVGYQMAWPLDKDAKLK